MFYVDCDPDAQDHLFAAEMPAAQWGDRNTLAMFPDDLRCVCGVFTWGEMNRRLEETEQLEAMWRR